MWRKCWKGWWRRSRKKTLKNDFLCRSLPLLTFGLIAIYAFSIVSIYYVIIRQRAKAIDILVDEVEVGLVRKSELLAKDISFLLQDPLNEEYRIHGYFEEIVSQNGIYVSQSFDPTTIVKNFIDYKDVEGFVAKDSIWYKSPTLTQYGNLDDEDKRMILYASTLHYPIKYLFSDYFSENLGFVQSVYFGFEQTQLLSKYPSTSQPIYSNWEETELPWDEFDSGKMDYYDVRCRDFYQLAESTEGIVLYGPYINPNKDMSYLGTLSQAVYNSSELFGVLNTDIRFQFNDTDSPFDESKHKS